jgi:C-terminal processing protease CtpA/Prc
MNGNRKKRTMAIAAAVGVAALGVFGCARWALLSHGPGRPPQKDMPVDGAMRAAVIHGLIDNLERHYVYPDKAAVLEQQLREQLARGDFDSVTSANRLAERLTELLRRDTKDKHLEVLYFEQPVPERSETQEDSPEEKAAEHLHDLRLNYGFESVGRLRGDIGYIDLHVFARPQDVQERIAATMALLADTKGLIVDLRECGGGDPETVMLFASYLFDQRTHLNDIYWRDESRTEERWTQESVPGKKYGQSRPIYLLTSEDTFSGCEDFAYALQNGGRATIIGETTGGGAHPGAPHRLEAHFMTFIPSGRAINPVTHTDWEGVGVAPNIKASAKDALHLAHLALLRTLFAVETDASWKEKLGRTIADLK